MLLSLSKSFASSLIFFVVFTKNPTIRHASRMTDRTAMKANKIATFIAELSDPAISRTSSIIDVEVDLSSLIFMRSKDRVGTGAAESGTVNAQINRKTLVIFVLIKVCECVITVNSEIVTNIYVKERI